MPSRANADQTPYHHGNLGPALLQAGVELARAGGPDAVILREAQRRVGVSHNAGYRHFPDRNALLREVAATAMAQLATLMETLIAEVPGDDHAAIWSRLRATGRAYVHFALDQPGLFRTAFGVPGDKPALLEHEGAGPHGLGPYGILARQLDQLAEIGQIPPARRPMAEFFAWSTVHGLSMLMVDGPLRELATDEREAAIQRVLDDIERALSNIP